MWMSDRVWKKPEKAGLFFQRMQEMGVNTGMADHDADPKPFVEAKFPFYVENVVNKGLCLKFSSHVTDWSKFVNEWSKKRDEAGLVRDYCLDDPAWRKWADGEIQRTAKQDMAFNPLAYNIRDELSTTYSANPFDYDFSPLALESFRKWLQGEYRDLAALNAEWGTEFKEWSEVKPFTTDKIKNRMASGDAMPKGNPDWQSLENLKFDPAQAVKEPARWNFAPWCDFRSYMDSSLASALGEIRNASHAVDPHTPVGIEGTQMPNAFGGYDLWKLSQVLDWVEPYDIGNSREIYASFMQGKPVLTTVFESDGKSAQRRLWHLLLEGDKGCLIWWSDDCIDWNSDDYALTPKAKALGPVLNQMTSPLARLFLNAERQFDPVAVNYSQPSIQADWLIETTEDGASWIRRFSSYESSHNRHVTVRDAWMKALTDLGYSPRFVSSEQIGHGDLRNVSAVILPDSLALSDKEAAALNNFAKQHPLLADGAPGAFDEHGRLRTALPFASLTPAGSAVRAFAISGSGPVSEYKGDAARYAEARLTPEHDFGFPQWIAQQLQSTCPPPISVPLESRTAVFRYRLGNAALIAFERNADYQMSEDLSQKGGNGALEHPQEIKAKLRSKAHVYDLRTNKYAGFTDELTVALDPWQPSLYALFADKLADDDAISALTKLLPKTRE